MVYGGGVQCTVRDDGNVQCYATEHVEQLDPVHVKCALWRRCTMYCKDDSTVKFYDTGYVQRFGTEYVEVFSRDQTTCTFCCWSGS